MTHDPYVERRALPRMIQDICLDKGIEYQAFSDNWVLRLHKDGRIRWIVGNKFDANSSAAGKLADDKVATYMTLAAAGLRPIEHYLVRAVPHDPTQWRYNASNLEGRPVVIKPLDGHAGRAVERYETAREALHAAQHSGEPAWAISPYYDLQAEYRLIMLGDELLLAYEKTQPTMRGKLKLFNLGQGAVAVGIADSGLLEVLRDMAKEVTRILSLGVAAVDIVRTAEGDLRVLEVNDGISMEHYIQQGADCKERAQQVYSAIIDKMFS